MHSLMCGQLIEWYIAFLEDRPSAKKYEQIYQQKFAGSELAYRPANQVTTYDLMLYKQQNEKKPAHCRKALQLITQAYNWAMYTIDQGTMRPLYAGINPGHGVKKPIIKVRERLMDHSEIRLVLKGIHCLPPKFQAIFLMLLLVPGRIKEKCEIEVEAVNWDTGKWFKRVTKNGTSQFTLIPSQVMPYLVRWKQQLPARSKYVFPGLLQKPMQRETVRKVWAELREELRMPDVWLLDFRRTLSSYLYTEIKADDLTAKAVLNHYDGRPVAVYTRLNYDRLAEIIQHYANWLFNLKEVPHAGPTARAIDNVDRLCRATP